MSQQIDKLLVHGFIRITIKLLNHLKHPNIKIILPSVIIDLILIWFYQIDILELPTYTTRRWTQLLNQNTSILSDAFINITLKIPDTSGNIYFYSNYLLCKTDTFTYRILYSQIRNICLFETEEIGLLICMHPSICQGNQMHTFLGIGFPRKELKKIKINATREELQSKYATRDGKQILNETMHGPTYDIFSRLLCSVTGMRIIAARKYQSATSKHCIPCSLDAMEGFLFPLEKSFIFVWKSPLHIRHQTISSIGITGMEQDEANVFNLALHLKEEQRLIVFIGIDKAEYNNLATYLLEKRNLTVINRQFHKSLIDIE